MNVLVIPEDYPRDELMLLPIVKAMLKHLGKPKAKVAMCRKPRLQGIGEALNGKDLQKSLTRTAWLIYFCSASIAMVLKQERQNLNKLNAKPQRL